MYILIGMVAASLFFVALDWVKSERLKKDLATTNHAAAPQQADPTAIAARERAKSVAYASVSQQRAAEAGPGSHR